MKWFKRNFYMGPKIIRKTNNTAHSFIKKYKYGIVMWCFFGYKHMEILDWESELADYTPVYWTYNLKKLIEENFINNKI